MLTPSSGTLVDYNAAVLNGNAISARLVFPVQNITLDGNDISANGGIQLTSILNPDTDLQMGKAVSTEVVCHLLNSNVFSGFDWTEEFHLDFGVDINGTTNWVTVGYFTGEKPEKVLHTDVIEFTAYDRMRKFDAMADDFLSTLTYPKTLTQIYSALCTYVGLTKVSGNEISGNMSMSFSASPFMSGMTLRGILSAIAEAAGCYAKITADGKVKLVWFSNQTSNYSVDGDDYFTVNVDEDDASVPDYIRVGCTYDDSVSGFVYPVGGSGECYQILDNPFLLNLSSANLTTVLTNIMSRFTSFGDYRPMGVNITGNWMVEVGDIIEVEVDNVTYSMPIFGRTLHFDGGCSDGYECTGKASRTQVTETSREQMEQGGKIANKYTIRSGVDITDEGVTISGGKYLKLISGGVLDVQATNFKIDSTNKTFSAGNWVFTTNGFTLTSTIKDTSQNNHKLGFAIGNATQPSGTETFAYLNFGGDASSSGVMPYIAMGFKRSSTYGFNPAYFKIRQWANDRINIYSDTDDLILGFPSAGLGAKGQIKELYVEQIGDNLACPCENGYFNNLGGDCKQLYTAITSGIITWESSAVTPANCSYSVKKWGNIIELVAKIYVKSAISGVWTTLGNLASDYRPSTNRNFTVSTPNGAIAHLQLQSNGNLRFRNANASSGDTTSYFVSVVYFI